MTVRVEGTSHQPDLSADNRWDTSRISSAAVSVIVQLVGEARDEAEREDGAVTDHDGGAAARLV